MATKKDSIGQKIKYIKLVGGMISIIIVIFGAVGAYISDRTAIQQNKEATSHNKRQIEIIKDEFRSRTEKENDILQQILIKITRLETKSEVRKV